MSLPLKKLTPTVSALSMSKYKDKKVGTKVTCTVKEFHEKTEKTNQSKNGLLHTQHVKVH